MITLPNGNRLVGVESYSGPGDLLRCPRCLIPAEGTDGALVCRCGWRGTEAELLVEVTPGDLAAFVLKREGLDGVAPANLPISIGESAPSSGCPACNAPEVEAQTPQTVYACGSRDYDQRPETFWQTAECEARAKKMGGSDADLAPVHTGIAWRLGFEDNAEAVEHAYAAREKLPPWPGQVWRSQYGHLSLTLGTYPSGFYDTTGARLIFDPRIGVERP